MNDLLSHRSADRLAVRGLALTGHHGVFDFERRDGQEFVIDLVLSVDTRSAAQTDDLQETVDYGTLVDQVSAAVEHDPVDLIETLAQRIADVCLSHDRGRGGRSDRAQAARPDPGDVRGRRPDHHPEPIVTRSPRNPNIVDADTSPVRCTPSAAP